MIENKEWCSLQSVIEDVNSLGDWRDPEGIKDYLRVLAKITKVYLGYSMIDGDIQKTFWVSQGNFPDCVMNAIVEVCKTKFPTEQEVFDQNGKELPNLPNHANYLPLVSNPLYISLMGERSNIYGIARDELGFGELTAYKNKDNVRRLIKTSRIFMRELKRQQKMQKNEDNETL